MGRRRKPKTVFPHPLKPGDIPPGLAEAGWRYKSRDCAERIGPDGQCTAFVATTIEGYTDVPDWYVVWEGNRRPSGPGCVLDATYKSPVEAMYAVEGAEREGPLSTAWRGRRGPPQFPDWTHSVRRGCHVWVTWRPGCCAAVVQLPLARYGSLRYAVIVNSQHLTDGTGLRLFDNPSRAIYAAEDEMRGVRLPAPVLVTE